MVPGIVVRVAGNSGRNPVLIEVVPDIPFVAAGDAALMSPDEAEIVEELIDIKLHRLGKVQVGAVEINVISEVVVSGNESLIGIGHALRRECADQMVVEKSIRIDGGAAKIVLRRRAAHRRGIDSLSHGESDAIAGRGRAIDEAWRTLTIHAPACAVLQVRE